MTNAEKHPCPSRSSFPEMWYCTKANGHNGLHEARTDHADEPKATWGNPPMTPNDAYRAQYGEAAMHPRTIELVKHNDHFDCPLCGQRIDDGLPCGCGARQ